ncbi:unnamed protein product [Ilex paraguariensis]|uniref:EF-hand domain-containing protein n=1 Tax=Ilex paraguariensis TaxID=185542 RepID=A0ABC8UDD2_9AQUA
MPMHASYPLSQEQLKGILKKHDTNGDGKLSREELKAAFRSLGLQFSGWKAWRAVHHVDANRDGYEQLKGILKKHDTNGDGKLSREELKAAFRSLGLQFSGWKAWRAVHHVDANRDGYVSEEEMNELVKYAMQWGFTIN